MMDKRVCLKQHYDFSDFIYYTAFLAIPLITAMVAVLDKSGISAVIFFIMGLLYIPVILRFFCAHCPHAGMKES